MFIQSHRGDGTRMINLARVVHAWRETGQKSGWKIEDTQGDSHFVSDIDWDVALSITPASTFAAAPGTSVIWCWEDGGEWQVGRSTVVGWAVSYDGELRPLCLDPEAGEDDYFIEHPDGHIEARRSLDRWNSAAQFLAAQKEKVSA